MTVDIDNLNKLLGNSPHKRDQELLAVLRGMDQAIKQAAEKEDPLTDACGINTGSSFNTLPLPLLQQEQKVGSKGRVSIWNKALNAAGFTAGTAIAITHNHNAHITRGELATITIKPAASSKRKVSRCINHGKELPVIDLKHTKALPMADLFRQRREGETVNVTVTIQPNLVTITRNV